MSIENKVVLGDSITDSDDNALNELPDNSVHFCLTDPPYGLDKMGDGWDEAAVQSKKYMKTVTSLPAGMKFDPGQGKRLRTWMEFTSKKVHKVLVPGAYYCVFCSPRLYHHVALAIEDAGFHIKDMYLWMYLVNQPKAMSLDHIIRKRKDLSDEAKAKLRERLSGWKTPQVKSNHEPIVFAQKPFDGGFLDNELKYGVGLINTNERIGISDNMFPSNVLFTMEELMELEMTLGEEGFQELRYEFYEQIGKHFLVSKPSKQEKGVYNTHKTVKPISLCEYLIRLLTKKGQTVLDPFAGSGTTVVAAKRCGRGWYGIEYSKTNYEIIEKRLEAV